MHSNDRPAIVDLSEMVANMDVRFLRPANQAGDILNGAVGVAYSSVTFWVR